RQSRQRTGHPAPGAAEVGPATVVRHGIAPGRVIYPGPAPGVHPRPMPLLVRGPIGGHAIRYPDVAVARLGAPSAVAIEVLVADYVARDIARGCRIVAAVIAIACPAVEVVVRRSNGLIVAQVGTREAIALARIDHVGGRAVAIRLALATSHHHRRCI